MLELNHKPLVKSEWPWSPAILVSPAYSFIHNIYSHCSEVFRGRIHQFAQGVRTAFEFPRMV